MFVLNNLLTNGIIPVNRVNMWATLQVKYVLFHWIDNQVFLFSSVKDNEEKWTISCIMELETISLVF